MAGEHSHDRSEQLAQAEQRCAAAGETFTPLRRRVLEMLIDAGGPAKAYDLLEGLRDGASSAKPPTIYRALEFLTRLGLAHRIESMNAFVACDVGACARSTIFLICDSCGQSEEIDAGHALTDVAEAAREAGFKLERTMIEAHGRCRKCTQP